MPERHRLPNRRACYTFSLEVDGLHYTCSVGRFEDGSIGEIFLNNHRSNSAADTNARDAAVAFSIARQFGTPTEIIRAALCRDLNGRACGVLGAALDQIAADEA